MSSHNQFELLGQRRFAPFFWAMFLGAFNDNIYKNALVIMVAFQGATLMGLAANDLVNLAGAIFIAPYILLSATAGQLADKYEKSMLIQRIKLLEVAIMVVGALGFMLNSVPLLMTMLFLLGCQATLFGPVKYSILPQHLNPQEITGGNGVVEMGMFVAILTGTLLGGVLIGDRVNGTTWVVIATLFCAIAGWLASRWIPHSPAPAPDLKINWNLFTETWRNYQSIREQRVLWLSILGNSWFWFYGAIFLAQVPGYTKDVLRGNETVVTVLLAVFSLGIGIGSLLCEKLSQRKVEIGLVPFGAIGMTVFAIDLALASLPTPLGTEMGAGEFLSQWQSWRILVDLALIGAFGGFFIVPLYALLQTRSKVEERARVIAGNNIVNALFVVASAGFAILLFKLGFSITQLFLAVAILNALVAIYIFLLVPEFLLRFLAWILVHTVYRLRVIGAENLPQQGPVLLVCNHVAYSDPVVLFGACSYPVRFVMDHRIFKIPGLHWLFKAVGAIPIAQAKEDPSLKMKAFEDAAQALKEGYMVGLFPEGQLTRDGNMNPFRGGVSEVLARSPVPVVPMALRGLWGSFFSRQDGAAMTKPFRRGLFSRIELVIAPAIPAEEATPERLQAIVAELRGEWK